MMMLAITMPPISYLQVALAKLGIITGDGNQCLVKTGNRKIPAHCKFSHGGSTKSHWTGTCVDFAREQWYEVLAILTFMSIVATIAAKNRVKKPYQGLFWDATVAVFVSSWVVAIFGGGWVLSDNAATWFRPQVMIPLLGLI
ncbi:MAG: ABC transporter permease [Moraxella sp.]